MTNFQVYKERMVYTDVLDCLTDTVFHCNVCPAYDMEYCYQDTDECEERFKDWTFGNGIKEVEDEDE